MTTMDQRERCLVWLIIGCFWLIGFTYSVVTPPFETPDEPYHYGFARNIALGQGLPIQDPTNPDTPWGHEGSQAPLYYMVAGRLISGIDHDDFETMLVRNPRANIGDPLFPGNKNFMRYSALHRSWQGTNLAVHVGRWFSLLLGGITLWLTYRIGRLALPRSWLALMAMLTVAAVPQFGFISGSFSNDNMIIVTSTGVLFWLAHLLTIPRAAPLRWWHWSILGLLLGLAAISKLPGLGLLGLAGAVVLALAWLRRDWRLPLNALLPSALPALLVGGWWYWRNQELYGSLLGISELLTINGLRRDPLTWGTAKGEFRGLRYSFWGLFGWFNILLPGWIYTVLDGVTWLALAGLVMGQIQQIRRHGRALLDNPATWVRWMLALWGAMLLGLIGYWATFATSSQGRLLFPGISAFAVLLVAGLWVWIRWLPRRGQTIAWTLLPTLLVGASIYALAVLLPNAYFQPRPLAAVPDSAQPLNVVNGDTDKLELLAMDVPTGRFRPGDDVPVTLYMRSAAPVNDDYQLFIQLLDETGREIGNVTTHPGWGRNPTTLWEPDAVYRDNYPVRITGRIDPKSPLLADLYIGFVNPAREESGRFPIVARNAAGEEITPFLARVVVEPATPPAAADFGLQPVHAELGGVVRLIGAALPPAASVTPGATITTTLMLEAVGQPATDYAAFVHLLAADGSRVAGFDQAPAGDRFPTSFWRNGDRIVTDFPLLLPADLPPGEYALWSGLYEVASAGALRLPVTDAGSLTGGDGQVLLGSVRVGP